MTAANAGELTCRDLVELVTDYLEGPLHGAKRRRFERHLHTCAGCRAYLAQMRALVRAAGRLSREDLHPAAREDLVAVFREWKRA
jgi:anti-sigma factor RsiW